MVLNNNKAGGIMISDFKTQYKTAVIIIIKKLVLARNIHEEQWHRTEIPEISPHISSQLIFDKQSKMNPEKKYTLQQRYW